MEPSNINNNNNKHNNRPRRQQGNFKKLRKIFVGGFDSLTKEKDLRLYFQRFGEIESLVAKKGGANARKGYCFVTFKDHKSVQKILAQKEHKFKNRTIHCNAYKKGKSLERSKNDIDQRRAFISNVVGNISEKMIRKAIGPHATVENCYITSNNNNSGNSRVAFLTLGSKEEVDLLLGTEVSIGVRRLNIRRYKRKEDTTKHRGGQGGRGGYRRQSTRAGRDQELLEQGPPYGGGRDSPRPGNGFSTPENGFSTPQDGGSGQQSPKKSGRNRRKRRNRKRRNLAHKHYKGEDHPANREEDYYWARQGHHHPQNISQHSEGALVSQTDENRFFSYSSQNQSQRASEQPPNHPQGPQYNRNYHQYPHQIVEVEEDAGAASNENQPQGLSPDSGDASHPQRDTWGGENWKPTKVRYHKEMKHSDSSFKGHFHPTEASYSSHEDSNLRFNTPSLFHEQAFHRPAQPGKPFDKAPLPPSYPNQHKSQLVQSYHHQTGPNININAINKNIKSKESEKINKISYSHYNY